MYSIKVTIKTADGKVVDEKKSHFGMRKFAMDENSTPKGAFYLNNERIILRGTNEMGHLPKAVMDGDDVIFPVHTLAEEVRANNFVARSDTSVYTKEFGEEDFKDFYNADKGYRDITAWFKFEWRDAEEILYTFEDSDDKKYALHKKHKLICGEKRYGKGSVILTTLSAVNGCVGNNPTLDKFLTNLIDE